MFKTELSDNTPTIKRTTLTTWELAGGTATWGPRVVDATVTDNENGSARFSSFVYGSYNLPLESYSFKGANASGTMLQKTTTSYLLTSAYVSPTAPTGGSKWIVGLPAESNSYAPNDPSGTTFTNLSRVTYQYDQTPLTAQLPSGGSLSNHDTANFGTSFTARGNVSHVTKWDTVNTASSITTTTSYNTTGLPIEQSLPDNNLTGRKTLISYIDAFSDATAINNTFAYPTTVTDPDGNAAKLKYRYDIGAVVRTQDPKMIVADASKGIVSTYDAVGRIRRTDNEFSGAYTKYTYDTSFAWANTFTKADVAGNELYGAAIFDGHGRVRANLSSHPGSVGGLRSQFSVYDAMGRVVQSSNPTEINGGWSPTGDDAAGYVWSQQTYDWKGRPKITTNQDGSTKQYEYGGCGCTGEATATVTDEVGRKTRQISDAYLDNATKVSKTEVLQLSAGQWVPYSTTATIVKPLERKVYEIEAAGLLTDYTPSATGNFNSVSKKQTTISFNGYGRKLQQQTPQQTGATPYTVFEYYSDGSIKKSTDARGVSGSPTYNARGLLTKVTYADPANAATTTFAPEFQYDELGLKTQMKDAAGTVDYTYNPVGQLITEKRKFTDLPAKEYQIGYEYNVLGKVKKITDPTGDQINYDFDLTQRLTSVSGVTATGNRTYLSNIQYRAWDAIKSVTQNNGHTASYNFDAVMRVKRFQMPDAYTDKGSYMIIAGEYNYFADGRLNTMKGVTASNLDVDRKADQKRTYDDFGRIASVRTGPAAGMVGIYYHDVNSSSAQSNDVVELYNQDFGYNAFDHLESRTQGNWSLSDNQTFTATYLNDRATSVTNNLLAQTWDYDALGNLKKITEGTTVKLDSQYDAMGRLKATDGMYDGKGDLVKVNNNGDICYLIRSSILGNYELMTIDAAGTYKHSIVYANGEMLCDTRDTFIKEVHDPLNTMGAVFTDTTQPDGSKALNSRMAMTPQGDSVRSLNKLEQTCQKYPQNPYCSGQQTPLQLNVSTYGAGFSAAAMKDWGAQGAGLTNRVLVNGVWLSEDMAQGYTNHVNSINNQPGIPANLQSLLSALGGSSLDNGRNYQVVSKWRDKSVAGTGKLLADGTRDGGSIVQEEYYELVEVNVPGQQDNQVHIKHLESDNYGGKNGGEKAATVWAILHGFANNKACVDAYKALKVAEGGKQEKVDGVDIVGMLGNNFINVGTSNFFSSNSDARISQETGLNQSGVNYFRGSSGGQARTNAHKEDFTGKVIPTIILSDELFDKKGPTLAQVLAHELIHAGGIRAKDPTRSTFIRGRGNGPGDPSDLDFLGKAYDNVIKTCVDGLPDNLKN